MNINSFFSANFLANIGEQIKEKCKNIQPPWGALNKLESDKNSQPAIRGESMGEKEDSIAEEFGQTMQIDTPFAASGIELLPKDILLEVFANLEGTFVASRISLVCKKWHCLSNDKNLWYLLYAKHIVKFNLALTTTLPILPRDIDYYKVYSLIHINERNFGKYYIEVVDKTHFRINLIKCTDEDLKQVVRLFQAFSVKDKISWTVCLGPKVDSTKFLKLRKVFQENAQTRFHSLELRHWIPNKTDTEIEHLLEAILCYIGKNLRTIDLYNTSSKGIQDNALAEIIRHCPLLESINLQGNKQITDVSFRKLITSCSKLQHINIAYCDNLSQNSLQQLVNCTQLKSLDIRGHEKNSTKGIVNDLIDISKKLKLEEIHLHTTEDQTNINNLLVLVESVKPQLRKLIVTCTSHKYICHTSLITALTSCPNLQFLACDATNKDTMKNVLECHSLEELNLTGTISIDWTWVDEMSNLKKLRHLRLAMDCDDSKLTADQKQSAIVNLISKVPNLEQLHLSLLELFEIDQIVAQLSILTHLKNFTFEFRSKHHSFMLVIK
jgi:hypothetical protein